MKCDRESISIDRFFKLSYMIKLYQTTEKMSGQPKTTRWENNYERNNIYWVTRKCVFLFTKPIQYLFTIIMNTQFWKFVLFFCPLLVSFDVWNIFTLLGKYTNSSKCEVHCKKTFERSPSKMRKKNNNNKIKQYQHTYFINRSESLWFKLHTYIPNWFILYIYILIRTVIHTWSLG